MPEPRIGVVAGVVSALALALACGASGASVPPVSGLAICTFAYYNYMGIRANGVLKYLAHFAGPIWWLGFLMFPLEIISNLARLLSLTIRLWGNMFAGEQVTNVFLQLTYLIGPAVFMGLHVFVSLMQAYVFALLTVIYVSMVTAHEEPA